MTALSSWRTAFLLSIVSVLYTILEGLVSTLFGAAEESLSLFGFGLDSFAEVSSAVGVGIMTWRLWHRPSSSRFRAEGTALRVTGISFFLISLALFVSGLSDLVSNHAPVTALPGILISVISICATLLLVLLKLKVGNALKSDAILADARCGMFCISMSVVVLVSSLLYALWGLRCADGIGAIVLAFLSFREGRGTWRSAKSSGTASCCC